MSKERKDKSLEEYVEKLSRLNAAELAGEIYDLENSIIMIIGFPQFYGVPYNRQLDELINSLDAFIDAAKEAYVKKVGIQTFNVKTDQAFLKHLDEYHRLRMLRNLQCVIPGAVYGFSVKDHVTQKIHRALFQTLFGLYEREVDGNFEYFIVSADYADPFLFYETSLSEFPKLCRKKRVKPRNLVEHYRISYGCPDVIQYVKADEVKTDYFKKNICVFKYHGPRKMIDGKRFESIMLTRRAMPIKGTTEMLVNAFEDFVVLGSTLDKSLYAEFTWYDMNHITIMDTPPTFGLGEKLPTKFPFVAFID